MRPKERQESGAQDLFRARLDQIIDLGHALVRLALRLIGSSSRANSVRSIPTNPVGHH